MKFSFEIKIGKTKFTIQEDAKDHLEFFQKTSFFTGLPEVGPNGEEDLELRSRKTKKGHYYSIVSQKAGKEFRLGISQQEPGTLFPKGWETLYQSQGQEDNNETEQEEVSQQTAPAVSKTSPRGLGIGRPSIPKPQAAVTQVPTPTEHHQSHTAVVSSSVPNTDVNNILARFGIKKG